MKTLLRAAAVLLLLGAFVSPAVAAVVFDAFGNGTDTFAPTSPYTFSITLGAGTKGVQVHIAYFQNSGAGLATITGVTVGGGALSFITGSDVSNGITSHAETWGGSTALAGAQTVSITFSGPQPTGMVADATSATGIDTTTPVNAGAGSTNTTTPLSLSMTSTAGDLTSTMLYGPGAIGGLSSNKTLRWSSFVNAPAGGDTGDATTNPTHTWTDTAVSDWNLGGVVTGANFRASGGGDVTPPTTPGTPAIASVTTSSARVTWAASTDNIGVSAYDLQRAQGTNSFVQIATPTTASAYSDGALAPSTLYTWRVRARDAAGNVSAFATSASTNSLNSVSRTLSWTATAPLTQDGFAIYRCVTLDASCAPDGSGTPYATTSAFTYQDTVSANPTTCYQVRATLAGTAGSALSNIACASGGAVSLTITAAGNGTGFTIPTGTTTYTNGTIVNLTATPDDPGTFFAGWSGAADCTDGSVTLTSSTICTATFTRQSDSFAYLGVRGSTSTRSLTNIISVTPTASVSKNNMLILRVVTDNISTTSGQTGDHLKATDSQGNQYVKLGEQTHTTGSAGSGVTVSMWATRLFATITTANTVNVTLSTATIANSVTLQEYFFQASTTFTNATTTGTNGASASPSAVISGLSSLPRLFIAALGVEQPRTASFTQSNDYSSFTTTNGTIGSASNANVQSIYGTLYNSASTGGTYAPALAIGTTPNWALVFSALATAPSVNTHPLTLATQGTGNGTVTGGGTYYEGSVVQIQAFPDASSQFAGWFTTLGSTCTSPTNPTVNVTVSLDTICTASFTTPNVVLPNRVLTIATAGTGTGTTTGAGTYPNGTVVNMTAAPGASSSFAGWTPAVCSSGSVTLTADTTCTATFTLLANATMTITNAGTGLGVTTGAGTYVQGTNAILTATPNVGSIFTGWSGSSGCTGTTSPLTVLMDASKTCVANFTVFTGTGPSGFLVQQSNKRCPVSYQLALTSTLTIANVTWRVDGVNTMSQNPGGVMTQTSSPFIFTKTLVKDGAVITANVTDVAGAAAVIGPNVVACP